MIIKGNMKLWNGCQRGAAMVELLVSLPALLLMGLGSLQTALLFDAKTTINYATFEAARVGAVEHAQSDAMREELGLRLAPLFGGDGSAERAVSAITRSSLDVQDSRFTEIDIINPTIEAFDEFGRNIVDPRSGDAHFGIPNSHLRWRSILMPGEQRGQHPGRQPFEDQGHLRLPTQGAADGPGHPRRDADSSIQIISPTITPGAYRSPRWRRYACSRMPGGMRTMSIWKPPGSGGTPPSRRG